MVATISQSDEQPGVAASAVLKRRAHPSKTARSVALVSSIASTFGVGLALAHAGRPANVALVAGTTPSTGAATTAAGSGSTAPAAASNVAATSSYADGVYSGAVTAMRWGNVRVRVTIRGGRITAVQEIEAPGDRKSASINAYAQPLLESEAVAAQSARIDAVSGATYTSAAYATSLQAALDQAAGQATSATPS